MLKRIFDVRNGKDYIYAVLRIVILLAFSALLFLMYPRTVDDFDSVMDIAIPAAVGLGSLLVVGIVAAIPQIRKYALIVVIPADWALIASYVYFLDEPDLMLVTGITMIIAVSGILRVGALFGVAHAIGSVVAGLGMYALRDDVLISQLSQDPLILLPAGVFILTMFIVSLVWYLSLDEENMNSRVKIRDEISESRQQMDEMRELTRAVAEMATELNSTLNFERIIDTSLNVGQMSVRAGKNYRTVSLALMVDENGGLVIEDARGLPHTDTAQTFAGEQGIIKEAFDSGEPVIMGRGGNKDPELGRLRAFASMKSLLAIPLRANFETYGVLVFGSEGRDAINEDHIDTLGSIGVQVTVALKNAVLYNNLREEKERILRIEENGRKALVRDLHDIPTQTVSAVAMHLSTIPIIADRQPERLKEEVENIRGMALRATEEIRHVMFTLRPLALENSGLVAALNQLSEKMNKTYGQPMTVKVDRRIEAMIDKEAQGTLFYLIEEAANNARKYAKASMIQVSGGVKNNAVIVRIQDNGKGFDVAAVGDNYENRGSFGMVNMRERAELINGTLDLQSTPGRGTSRRQPPHLITARKPHCASRTQR
ncbi:MAG: GAF domain-containing sensor histidine kinase [Chloroflexota bacterium]